MKEQIGRTVKIGECDYVIKSIIPFNPEHKGIIRACEETGKYAAYFSAAKVLRSGKVSEKQTKLLLKVQSILLSIGELTQLEIAMVQNYHKMQIN